MRFACAGQVSLAAQVKRLMKGRFMETGAAFPIKGKQPLSLYCLGAEP